ncbi:MAG: VOC family protein [Vicinamibacterales bacterium]
MPVDQLQHVNIRCVNAARSRDFYVDLIGLVDGDRPPVGGVGHWLYVGGVPVIHLTERTAAHGPAIVGSGTIDHIAFRGVDLEGTRARFEAAGVQYRQDVIPRNGTIQLFVHDPDGVKVELNFEPD